MKFTQNANQFINGDRINESRELQDTEDVDDDDMHSNEAHTQNW